MSMGENFLCWIVTWAEAKVMIRIGDVSYERYLHKMADCYIQNELETLMKCYLCGQPAHELAKLIILRYDRHGRKGYR